MTDTLHIAPTKKGWKIVKPEYKGKGIKSIGEPELHHFSKADQKKLIKYGKNIQSGGSIFSGVKNLYNKVKEGVNTAVHKVEEIGHKVIHGRMDYPPSAKKIIDDNNGAVVQSAELHRIVLPSIYRKILNVWTQGEAEKRIKEEPKDKLFHMSMWVKLSNGKTILVEKLASSIHLQVNPSKPKEQESQVAPNPPANLTFGEMLEKAHQQVGDHKFFTYSTKDNNCGNFIEYILKANGMDSQATHDFIGQDAKKILAGFPLLRKTVNTLTDISGRANVLLEGGTIEEQEQEQKQLHGKGFGTAIARKLYDWWKPPMSFEEWREREQSRFKSDAEAEHALSQAKADRILIEEERKLAKLKADTEAHRQKLREVRDRKLRLAEEVGVWLGDDNNYVNWDEARRHFARKEATDKQIEAEDPDWDNTTGYGVEKIGWEDIKWGSFTEQFKRYKQEHPNSKIDDLEEFAHYILTEHHTHKFQPRTLKRARFYLNVILKKKSQHSIDMPRKSKHAHGGAIVKMPDGTYHGVGSDSPEWEPMTHPAQVSPMPHLVGLPRPLHNPLVPTTTGTGIHHHHYHGRGLIDEVRGLLGMGLIDEARALLGVGLYGGGLYAGSGTGLYGGSIIDQIGHAKKMKGGRVPAPPSRSPITDPSLL